jgi:hypothetical protein
MALGDGSPRAFNIQIGDSMSKLYSIIQVEGTAHTKPYCYSLYELDEPHAWFQRPNTADPDVMPISKSTKDPRYKLTANQDRYLFLLEGYNGGVIYWGKSHSDVIRFISKSLLHKIAAEEKA